MTDDDPNRADGPEEPSGGADEPTDDYESTDHGDDSAESGRNDGSIFDSGADWLSSLLSALDSREGRSTAGRRRADRSTLEYDVSIRSIADALEESSRVGAAHDGESADSDDRQRRKRRRRSSTSTSHHLTVRHHDDVVLVTADVAGADPDEVTVGFSESTLVVAVAGRELERIDVPWIERTAEARIKNGVLTIRIEPDDETLGSDDGSAGQGGDR